MLTLDDIRELGVLLTEEQIDFFHHPEDRLAVAVFGVPDPDSLYTAGLDRAGTVYQVAPEGQSADDRGLQACVLPVVFIGDKQEELSRCLEDWLGDEKSPYPVVHGWLQNAEFAWAWTTDEIPFTAACWDLWPITVDEVQHWISAANEAYQRSALPAMFELIDHYNGSEYYGGRHAELEDEYYRVTREASNIEIAQELQAKMQDVAEDYLKTLEKQIIHPVTGEVDPQLPPVDLEPEQAAIWHSLQALSWRNWSTLAKNSGPGHDGDALYGGRFAEANRRLCPWY